MRCIQCMNFIGCECQRERDGVLFYVLHRAGFGNCYDIAIADCPGQRDSGRRAMMCSANTLKCWITQQASAGAAER